jgi:TonB family protein
MKSEEQNKYKGIIGTIGFHALLLVLFLFFGFRTPLPLPAEQGIAINFGTSDDGMGEIQPEQAADQQAANESAAASSSSSTSSEKAVATQETEAAPVIKPTSKTEPSTKPAETPTKPSETPTEDPKPSINTRALYPGKSTGSAGGSQGNTGKPGDQGKVDGSRDSNNQGDGSTGGLTGSPDFKLTGRALTQRPTISDQSQTEGKVVVTIKVNKNGEVIAAKAGAPGTTLSNAAIQKKCEDAALRARFSPNENAPEEQEGTITFIFKLQ